LVRPGRTLRPDGEPRRPQKGSRRVIPLPRRGKPVCSRLMA